MWCGFTLLEKSSLVRVFAVRDVLVRAREGGMDGMSFPRRRYKAEHRGESRRIAISGPCGSEMRLCRASMIRWRDRDLIGDPPG